jgi:hypothetical protein
VRGKVLLNFLPLFLVLLSLKQLLKEQSNDEENKQPMPMLSAINELKPLNPPNCEMIPLEKHKLEVEQRVKEENTSSLHHHY